MLLCHSRKNDWYLRQSDKLCYDNDYLAIALLKIKSYNSNIYAFSQHASSQNLGLLSLFR